MDDASLGSGPRATPVPTDYSEVKAFTQIFALFSQQVDRAFTRLRRILLV